MTKRGFSAPSPTVWVVLALIAGTLAVFAPVRTFQFLPWDDPHYVYANPHVAGGLTLQNFLWAFTSRSPYWHPLTWISLMLDVRAFGMSSSAMHLVGLAMHVLSVALLFLFLQRTTGSIGRSFFVAAIFAVHPMRVESVAWVAERKDVLPTLAMMVMLHAYVSYVKRPNAWRYALVTIVYLAGLLAKPILITLPFVLLLLDAWPLGRLRGVGPGEAMPDTIVPQPLSRLVIEKLPWLALAVATAGINMVVQAQPLAPLATVPLLLRFCNAAVFYVQYLALTIWPAGLSPLHLLPRKLPPWWVTSGAIAILAGISTMVVREARRRPYLAVGWLWYTVTIFPVIGFIQAGDQGVADRYGYIPLIGIYFMIAWGVPDLMAGWRIPTRAVAAIAAMAVAVAAIDARTYLWTFHDGMSLWRRAIAVDPLNHRAHANLADELAEHHQMPEAIAEYREAIRLAPEFPAYQRFLGTALARHGRVPEAVAELESVVVHHPDDAAAHEQLGAALARAGQFARAVAEDRTSVELAPTSPAFHASLCLALAQAGYVEPGLAACRDALLLDPDLVQAHSNLGVIALSKGNLSDAVAEFEAAQRLEPWSAERCVNLGVVLSRAGRLSEAQNAFDRALALDPRFAEAFNGRGALLSSQGKTLEAIEDFTRALEIDPTLLDVYSNRGRAFAIKGDLDAAMGDFETILRLDPDNVAARAAVDTLVAAKRRS